jgi:hypothetical protein
MSRAMRKNTGSTIREVDRGCRVIVLDDVKYWLVRVPTDE